MSVPVKGAAEGEDGGVLDDQGSWEAALDRFHTVCVPALLEAGARLSPALDPWLAPFEGEPVHATYSAAVLAVSGLQQLGSSKVLALLRGRQEVAGAFARLFFCCRRWEDVCAFLQRTGMQALADAHLDSGRATPNGGGGSGGGRLAAVAGAERQLEEGSDDAALQLAAFCVVHWGLAAWGTAITLLLEGLWTWDRATQLPANITRGAALAVASAFCGEALHSQLCTALQQAQPPQWAAAATAAVLHGCPSGAVLVTTASVRRVEDVFWTLSLCHLSWVLLGGGCSGAAGSDSCSEAADGGCSGAAGGDTCSGAAGSDSCSGAAGSGGCSGAAGGDGCSGAAGGGGCNGAADSSAPQEGASAAARQGLGAGAILWAAAGVAQRRDVVLQHGLPPEADGWASDRLANMWATLQALLLVLAYCGRVQRQGATTAPHALASHLLGWLADADVGETLTNLVAYARSWDHRLNPIKLAPPITHAFSAIFGHVMRCVAACGGNQPWSGSPGGGNCSSGGSSSSSSPAGGGGGSGGGGGGSGEQLCDTGSTSPAQPAQPLLDGISTVKSLSLTAGLLYAALLWQQCRQEVMAGSQGAALAAARLPYAVWGEGALRSAVLVTRQLLRELSARKLWVSERNYSSRLLRLVGRVERWRGSLNELAQQASSLVENGCEELADLVAEEMAGEARVNVDGSSIHQAAKRAAKKRAQREAKRAQRAAFAQHAGSGEESAGQTGDSLAQAVEGQQGVPAQQQQEQAQVSAGPTNDSGEGVEAEQLRRAEDAMLALLREEEEAAEAAAAQAARRAAKRRAKKQQRRQQQGSGEGSSAEGEGAGEADTAVGVDSQLVELEPAVSILSTSGSASAAAGPGQPALAPERGAHHSGSSSSASSDTGSAGAESAAGGEGARPGTGAAAGSASRPSATAVQQPAAGEGPFGPPSVPGGAGLHLLPHRAPATPEAEGSRPAPASPALQPRHHPVAVPEQQQAAEPQGQPVEQPAAQGQLQQRQQPDPRPAAQPLVATPPQWGALTARQRGAAAGYRPPMGAAGPAAPAQAAWPAFSAAPPRLQQPGTQPAAPPRGLGVELQGPSGGNQLTSTDGAHGACNPAAAAGGTRWAECVLCLDSQPDCALLPCRHLVVCTPCGEALWHPCAAGGTPLLCPVCRAEVEQLLPLFLP